MPRTAVEVMTKADARALMDGIIDSMEAAATNYEKARELFEQFAATDGWRLLGYRSLAGCLAAELRVSRQRIHQIMDEIKASALLSEVVGEPVRATSREAKAIKSEPSLLDRAFDVANGARSESLSPKEAVKAMLRDAEPVTREPFGGGTFGSGFDAIDEGRAIVECKRCRSRGTVGPADTDRFAVLRAGHDATLGDAEEEASEFERVAFRD